VRLFFCFCFIAFCQLLINSTVLRISCEFILISTLNGLLLFWLVDVYTCFLCFMLCQKVCIYTALWSVPVHQSVLICSPRWLLKQEVPKVVKSINRQLREKSIKTKVCSSTILWLMVLGWWIWSYRQHFQVGAFSVLKELVVVLPDCLADHFGSLVPGIEKALNVSVFHSLRKLLWKHMLTYH